MMLEFIGVFLVFIVGIVVGRAAILSVLFNEKEDRRVQYKGKIYKYSFEEEKEGNIYTINE